jgi:hypothetical protein
MYLLLKFILWQKQENKVVKKETEETLLKTLKEFKKTF